MSNKLPEPLLSSEKQPLKHCAPLKSEADWQNQDNFAFYHKITLSEMKGIAEIAGLSTGCDVKKIQDYWFGAKSVLEVGAGYGRVLTHLVGFGFQGKITAVEQSESLFKYLKPHYSPKVKLLHGDINDIPLLVNQFDLILCLWSGIADYSPPEQQSLMIRLAKLLRGGGKLIIDTLPSDMVPLGMKKSSLQKVYRYTHGDTVIQTYSLDHQEIDHYGREAGFTWIKHINYTTDTGRERQLHILS